MALNARGDLLLASGHPFMQRVTVLFRMLSDHEILGCSVTHLRVDLQMSPMASYLESRFGGVILAWFKMI